MTDKRKGAVILLGNFSAQESKPQRNLIGLILASAQTLVSLCGSQRSIMNKARSITGGDLGRLLSWRTIATPIRGVSLFYGGCLILMALLRPRSVWVPPDGNTSVLPFPTDGLPTRQAVPSILAGGWAQFKKQSVGV